jgi:hypothetical protein
MLLMLVLLSLVIVPTLYVAGYFWLGKHSVMTRVLLIEDEVRIADFLLRGQREEGYIVEYAHEGITG